MKFKLKSRIFSNEIVENKRRKFGAALFYYPAIFEDKGKEIPLLFTENDLKVAAERAKANMEDLPKQDSSSFLSWTPWFLLKPLKII